MKNKFLKISLLTASVSTLLTFSPSSFAATGNIVKQWEEVTLQAVRDVPIGPPAVARAHAIVSTCIFDAWAAYDDKAKGTRLGKFLRRPKTEQTNANKEKAISFAAHDCLVDLFPSKAETFHAFMGTLGYDPNDLSTDITTPSGIGNVAAKAVLDFRHHDGSNQLGDLHPGPYSDYTGYTAINTPTSIVDPNHWQPLSVGGVTQSYVGAQWGYVVPFALKSASQFRKLTPPPADYVTEPERYAVQAQQILEYTSHLTDEKKMIAEYWADGPHSEFPPGHWVLFSMFVSERDNHSLDQDAKLYFALSNALLDASIVAWEAKRHYDYVRPVTAIHLLYAGKPVESWQGTIDGADWKPYQAANVVTPPFPEYFSGHSSFSAAGAEILKSFTQSDYFGYSTTIPAGSSRVEPGIVPASDIIFYWATFSDAADEAGISRRYGGIHFVDGDLIARKIGRLVGQQAWEKALKYFNDEKEDD